MLKSLGGIRGSWILANEQIFNLVYQDFNFRKKRKSDDAEKNTDESKAVNYDHLWGNLQKIANQSENYLHKSPQKLFTKLLDSQIIRLGIEVSCSFCNQPSWYSIDDIRYKVKCLNCLELFSLPSHSPKNKLTWSYRTIGAFSPAAEHYGSYSALLALRFFTTILRGNTTPIFGLEIKRKRQQLTNPPEIDLALFFREDLIVSDKIELVFVECKTYNNRFQEKDINTMKVLSEDFPNAYFVFATLEKELNSTEKRLIIKFIKELNKKHSSKRTAQVLILTGTELYSDKAPPDCWIGKVENLSESGFIVSNKLSKISELSQSIHLS